MLVAGSRIISLRFNQSPRKFLSLNMKKVTFQLSALALSTALLLSSCGGADSAGDRAAENGNMSSPASAADNNMNGSVGNGGTSTDPEASAGQKSTSGNGTPGDVGSDASGTSNSSMSGAGTNSGAGAVNGAGSGTTNAENMGGTSKNPPGSNAASGQSGATKSGSGQ